MFDVYSDVPVSYEDALLFLARDTYVGHTYLAHALNFFNKATIAELPPAPPTLTYPVAIRTFLQESQKVVAQRAKPREVLASGMMHGVVQISESVVAITPHSTGKTEQIPVMRAMLTDDKELAMKHHLADALAYQYTKTTETTNVYLESNFSTFNGDRMPSTKGRLLHNKGWQVADAVDNSNFLLKQMAVDKSNYLALSKTYYENFSHLLQHENQSRMFKLIPNDKAPARYLVEDEQKRKCVPLIIPAVPPAVITHDIDVAWKVLNMHRGRRGEDKAGVSLMTTGYYLYTMSRGVEQVLWKVADIIHVAKVNDLKYIKFKYKPNYSIVLSLVYNGFYVFLPANFSTKPLRKEDLTGPNVFQSSDPPVVKSKMLTILPSEDFVRPEIRRDAVVYKDSAETFKSLHVPDLSMYWAFLSPALLESGCSLEYSMHAHAGHAIVLKGLKSMGDPKRIVERMVNANFCKTWFPHTRVPFIYLDKKIYGFHNFAIEDNMLMTSVSKKTAMTGTDGISFEEIDDIRLDKKFEDFTVSALYSELGYVPAKLKPLAPVYDARPDFIEDKNEGAQIEVKVENAPPEKPAEDELEELFGNLTEISY